MSRATAVAVIVIALTGSTASAQSDKLVYDGPKPPPITAIDIVPLGNAVPPELEGIEPFLRQQFPGLKVQLRALRPLPAAAYDNDRGQVMWERLEPMLDRAAGTIFVIAHDFSTYRTNFWYAWHDIESARAVASVSRMRDLGGLATPATTVVTGEMLDLSRYRFRNQLVSSTAKLLGLTFPCHTAVCVLRKPMRIREIDLKSQALCPNHQAEYAEIAKARGLATSPR
jgi:predicted Zn-dependent protease